MWKKWTRIICGVLTAAMLLTELPMKAIAASNTATAETAYNVYGDANGDGVLDAKDITAILQYIVEDNPSGFQYELADFNGDGSVDLKDLLAVRKHMADSEEEILSVSFYDGERLIDTLSVEKGKPLSAVPSVGKSSKANAVLLGYYTDQAFTAPFYAENPVTEDMKVYAKYQEMGSTEELNFTSFALMDQSADIAFRIKRASGNVSSESAVTLIVKDGSDPVILEITGPDGDGFYTVKAKEGFRKGASYELTLAEGWVFESKDETIRTAAFSIAMEEGGELRMNDTIIYIEDTDAIDYVVGDKSYAVLTTNEIIEEGGFITYEETLDASWIADIECDDILCIYVGKHPLERKSKNSKDNLEPAVYVKVTDINGTIISFAPLDADDQLRMYDIPDNFPIALDSQSVGEGDFKAAGSALGDDLGNTFNVDQRDLEDTEGVNGDVPENAEGADGNGAEGVESVDGSAPENAESVDGSAPENVESIDGNVDGIGSENAESVDGNIPENAESIDGNLNGNVPENTESIDENGSENDGNVDENEPENAGNSIGDEPAALGSGSASTSENTVSLLENAPESQSNKWEPDLNAGIGTVGNVAIDELLGALDMDMYKLMMSSDSDITPDDIKEKISIGDFITIYSSSDKIESEDSLHFAVITDYDETTGEITYKWTNKQAILECMDLYQQAVIDGDDLVTEEQKEEIEALLLSQLEESGFAEDAAYLLSDMVARTDGFRKNMSVQEFLLTDENGNPLTDEEIELLNLGGSFELWNIVLKVELVTDSGQLHYGGGVQLVVQVDADVKTDLEEGMVAIKLSASFVQEVALSPSVRGGIVTKNVWFIPVPIGVEVNAAIDIRSYTAFSFAAEIYTIEDENIWERLQRIYEKDTSGILKKINEVKAKIDQSSGTAEEINGYKEELETLWNQAKTSGLTTREELEGMEEALGKTSVASELLDMMDLAAGTDISDEYLDSMQALIDKYVETVEKETDWVQLVEQEIFSKDFYIANTPIIVNVEIDFVVQADMSVAIGSNLEYEVGKRYNFWFKVGLFKPTAGSSSMDLMDERFAFQFYVMGKLGVKAGIKAELAVGLGSTKFGSVGISAEIGPYVQLYGFFVYKNMKFRPANTQSWTSQEEMMAGALYLDFGVYYTLGFEAELKKVFEYSYDFLDEEKSLLTAGEARYYYKNAYKPGEDEVVVVRDEDSNSSNGITMKIPDIAIALSYVDLDSGRQGIEIMGRDRFNFTVSNSNFKFDSGTGVISVNVPENVRYMECDLTVTYLYGKLAFSQYDMSVTIPLVWTNLTTEELSEYYTASVRAGNDRDGYQTVWSKRVLKGQPFDLPSEEEIRAMIGWSDAKFTGGAGYGGQKTTGLTLIQDTVYDYNVDYKTYSVTVDGIQNPDGSTESRTYTAKYGEYFNFSDLAESGTEIPGETYTKFTGVRTDAEIMVAGNPQVIDLTERITGKAAEAIDRGISASADYVDDSARVIFEFTGFVHAPEERLIRRGTAADLDEIGWIVFRDSGGLDIVDITPAFGRVSEATVYQVICGELTGPQATIRFHANGGEEVSDITKTVGAYLGVFPEAKRTGYTFDGWYTDDGTFQNRFDAQGQKMMEGGIDLYAKWTANEYIVTFHVNGGNELEEAEKTKTVTYDSVYGSLPVPTRSGYGFSGWFTEAEGGTQVTVDTLVAITADQILYAHWRELKQIPSTVFDFGAAEGGVYQKGVTHDVIYSFDADGEAFTKDSFIIKYMRQGSSEYEPGLPMNAGTYDAVISRPADEVYAKFEYTYRAVITIDKAVRTIGAFEAEVEDQGYTYVKLSSIDGMQIDDLSSDASVIYQAKSGSTLVSSSANCDSYVYDLSPATSYDITVKVVGDPNYEDAESTNRMSVSTMQAPTDSWIAQGNYNTSWYYDHVEEDVFVLETAEDLAGLSYLVYEGSSFRDKTVKLTADVDLRGHEWEPIGLAWDGSGTSPWRGTFDGGNHKITGLYISGRTTVGLFGYVAAGSIENVLLDHSYIKGTLRVGGIVGHASGCLVYNCVNYAQVIAETGASGAGGIAGNGSDDMSIVNCVNYGSVQGGGDNTGGIVGSIVRSQVINNANYGRVTGVSKTGGIVGYLNGSSDMKLNNNFTVGTVQGSGSEYVGAVAGQVMVNSSAYYVAGVSYYLSNSATRNGTRVYGASLYGDGSKSYNTLTYKGTDILVCPSFDSPTSSLSAEYENNYDTLIQALNRWVTGNNGESIYAEWVEGGPAGYPIPKDSPIPDAVLTRVR